MGAPTAGFPAFGWPYRTVPVQRRRGAAPQRRKGVAFPAGLRYQRGMVTEAIDQLARRFAESLPQGVRSMRDDLEQHFRTVLQSGLSRMDLVTREEFEVQEAVLRRTREKLEALIGRLDELEKQAAAPKSKTANSPAKKAAKKTTKKPSTKKKPAKKASKAAKKR